MNVRTWKGGRCAVLATAIALAGACAIATQPGTVAAAGSAVNVSLTVPSQTTIVPTLCATGQSGRTAFGTVLPATKTVSSADCRVEFGSNNDTAKLRLTQTDREGQALWGGEATGAAEPTFDGGDGWRVHSIVAGSHERVFDAVMQDGRGLVTAGSQFVGADAEEFSVSRYRTDGTLDPTFGTAGNARLAYAGTDYASAIDLAPDGSIVVAGVRDSQQLVVARFSADGALVTSWGTGGVVTHDWAVGNAEEPLDMEVLADGSIVLGGWVDTANADAFVAKLDAAGALVPGFGVGGVRSVDVQGSRDVAWRLAVQADGKVLITGPARQPGNGEDDLFVARLTATGALDTATFGGGDGHYVYDQGAGVEQDLGSGLALLPDGRILAGGSTPGTGTDMLVLRLLANGTLDPTFGAGGVLTRHDGATLEEATDIDLLPDGTIAILGTRSSANAAVQMWRLRADGASDTSFSGDGYAELVISGYGNVDAREQVIGPDGSIMFAGMAIGADQEYLVGRLDSVTVPDYAAGRWTSASPLFGACLRDATNATPTWVEDGDLSCTSVDSDPWNPIARVDTDPTAEVARAAYGVVNAIVDLRFGITVASSQRPGALVAPITFEVIAPA